MRLASTGPLRPPRTVTRQPRWAARWYPLPLLFVVALFVAAHEEPGRTGDYFYLADSLEGREGDHVYCGGRSVSLFVASYDFFVTATHHTLLHADQGKTPGEENLNVDYGSKVEPPGLLLLKETDDEKMRRAFNADDDAHVAGAQAFDFRVDGDMHVAQCVVLS
jgi:hypothetical protein